MSIRTSTSIVCVSLALLLTSCMSYDFSRRVVQQGNTLPQAKIARLKIGMSKEQVATLLGSSLLPSTFDNNHWDYAYTWRRGNSAVKKQHLSLYFVSNKLQRIES